MKLAIMQPYFFPYLGYWQLFHAADCFVLFDDVQYIRRGWINRNRILKPDKGWQYFGFPVKKHAKTDLIKDVYVHPEIDWTTKVLGQLAHYKTKTPYYDEINALVHEALTDLGALNVTMLNYTILRQFCNILKLECEIIVSSDRKFDYRNVNDAGEWALRISEQMNAAEYINPSNGARLFSQKKFDDSNINLSFLEMEQIEYQQHSEFEPSLSLLDLMMFKGIEGAKHYLELYQIKQETELTD